MNSKARLDKVSLQLRRTLIDAISVARRGHVGSYLSIMEIVRVLYGDILRFDPRRPDWSDRDRFILSKGHGSLGLFTVLAHHGFFAKSELSTFCSFDSMLGQHPDARKVPGVEASTGALGHGLAIGVGMALAARILKQSHKIIVLISDAECQEGSIWEAAFAIHKHKLTNLLTIVDYNHRQSYGTTHEVLDLEPFGSKWKAFGFGVKDIDGHNISILRSTFRRALKEKIPQVVICQTMKGKGIDITENNQNWHHKVKITDDEIQALYEGLGKRF